MRIFRSAKPLYLLLLLVFIPSKAFAVDPVVQRQAELLFHALFMVDWPNSKAPQLNLCALTSSSESVAHVLASKYGLSSKRQPIHVHFSNSIKEALNYDREFGCDIYYLDPIFSTFNFGTITEMSYSRAILTLGHGTLFIEKGGMLSLIGEQKRDSHLQSSTQFRRARLLKVDERLIARAKKF
ncbi:hypothetical protein C2869_09060 [Saccharobesus litoralis]|uniref:YfiR family protein n=1 Tax=Saccharobesus litoralis TaxID=2172099 RepID=A0A2S0VR65_9ALTE|nr:YfiR/HmsC family protein [Saccharobesus litoralis]AWB66570.1 hypothetical protein C2869_09060 [Saccharobesus litoralis]